MVRFHELFLTHLGEASEMRPLSCLERSLIVRRLLAVAQLGAANFAQWESEKRREERDGCRRFAGDHPPGLQAQQPEEADWTE